LASEDVILDAREGEITEIHGEKERKIELTVEEKRSERSP
jgi:hypothetical protein